MTGRICTIMARTKTSTLQFCFPASTASCRTAGLTTAVNVFQYSIWSCWHSHPFNYYLTFVYFPTKLADWRGDITERRALFHRHPWYDARFVWSNSTSFVHGIVLSAYWPILNRLKRAILTSSVKSCPYRWQTYFWIFWNNSAEAVYVDPSDWKVERNSVNFSKVFKVFVLIFHRRHLYCHSLECGKGGRDDRGHAEVKRYISPNQSTHWSVRSSQ